MAFNEQDFWARWEKLTQKTHYEFSRHLKLCDYDKHIEISQNHAKEYAQLTIKYLFLINGGAIIALPAIIASFELPQNEDIWFAGLSFCLGLMCIVLTSLFAYWSVISAISWMAAEKYKNYTIFLLKNMAAVLTQEGIEAEKINLENYESEEKRGKFWASLWEKIAIVAGILSLIAFICGTYYLTKVVWLKQKVQIENSINEDGS